MEAPAQRPEEVTCERCDEPAFPGRGFCAGHLLESLGLEYDPERDIERAMNRQCVARRRDGDRCQGTYANRETKLCTDHQKALDGGVHFEDVLCGELPEEKAQPPKRLSVERVPEPIGNGAPAVVADVNVTAEEHARVEATIGDILRDARSSSREAIEETVALLLDATRRVKVVVPAGAKPGQTIHVQLPDLKVRLDGPRLILDRLEGRPAEAEPGPQLMRPRTLAEFERMTYTEMYAYIATSQLPAIKRLIEDGNPNDWEALRKSELSVGSLRWVVDELERMERRTPAAPHSLVSRRTGFQR